MVPQSSSNLQELCGLFGRSRPWLSSWHFNGFHHCWSSCVVLFLVILVNDDGHVHHMCVLGLYVSCFFFTPECDIVFTEKCSRFSKCCWFGVGALCLLVSTLVQLAHPNVIEVRLFFCGRVSWLYLCRFGYYIRRYVVAFASPSFWIRIGDGGKCTVRVLGIFTSLNVQNFFLSTVYEIQAFHRQW